jgi:uncharacterized protein (DUF1015 family)
MSDTSPALVPFRGLRFRSDVPGSLADTMGPPFDLDTSDEARAFVSGKPHCCVRLEIEDPGDTLTFQHARALLDEWREERILLRDDTRAYYVYEQRFEHDGAVFTRRGILGLVPLEAPDICVLPHEETWEENRHRRVQLLRELEASPSSVFLIYETQDRSLGELLRQISLKPPDTCSTDAFGNRHRIWVVAGSSDVDQLYESMRGQHFVIADGHHRFAAARIHHEEHRHPGTSLVLACCVEASDPGIVIRPIHRLIRSRDAMDLASAIGVLSEWFEIETTPVGDRSGRDLRSALSDNDLPEVGIITSGGQTFMKLRLRDWSTVEPLLPGGKDEPARQLDVTVITELVLRRALQLEPATTDAVDYFDDAEDILSLTRDETGIGLIMRPIRLSQVFAVARSGGTVPAKSTSFVPKIPVGLVLHEFGIPEQ